MRLAIYAAFSLAAAIALETYRSPPALSQGTDLAARLVGSWHGLRTTPISIKPENFTMTWKKAANGHLAGTVAMPGQPKYPVNVVWSSDTAFIYESAPHMSHLLHHDVVDRGTVHFKGNALQGTFEARPTKYGGKTITGTFTASRSA